MENQIIRIPYKYSELINTMEDCECGKLMKALFCKDSSNLEGLTLTYYNIIIVDINNLEDMVQKGRLNGKKGGRPKKEKDGGYEIKNPPLSKNETQDKIKQDKINKDNIKEDNIKEYNKPSEKSLGIIKENYNFYSFEYKTSKFFLDFHIENKTPSIIYLLKNKKEEEILQSWSKVIYDLQYLDKFTREQIDFIIKYTLKNDFWSKQILSIEKFRKKKDGVSYFVKMIDQAKFNKSNLQFKEKKGVI